MRDEEYNPECTRNEEAQIMYILKFTIDTKYIDSIETRNLNAKFENWSS